MLPSTFSTVFSPLSSASGNAVNENCDFTLAKLGRCSCFCFPQPTRRSRYRHLFPLAYPHLSRCLCLLPLLFSRNGSKCSFCIYLLASAIYWSPFFLYFASLFCFFSVVALFLPPLFFWLTADTKSGKSRGVKCKSVCREFPYNLHYTTLLFGRKINIRKDHKEIKS